MAAGCPLDRMEMRSIGDLAQYVRSGEKFEIVKPGID